MPGEGLLEPPGRVGHQLDARLLVGIDELAQLGHGRPVGGHHRTVLGDGRVTGVVERQQLDGLAHADAGPQRLGRPQDELEGAGRRARRVSVGAGVQVQPTGVQAGVHPVHVERRPTVARPQTRRPHPGVEREPTVDDRHLLGEGRRRAQQDTVLHDAAEGLAAGGADGEVGVDAEHPAHPVAHRRDPLGAPVDAVARQHGHERGGRVGLDLHGHAGDRPGVERSRRYTPSAIGPSRLIWGSPTTGAAPATAVVDTPASTRATGASRSSEQPGTHLVRYRPRRGGLEAIGDASHGSRLPPRRSARQGTGPPYRHRP